MVSAFVLQSPDGFQDIERVIYDWVLSWYLRFYFNLQIDVKISKG